MEEIKKIPSSDQIPAEDKWAIEDLYATDDAWEADRATLEESRKTLASFAGRLGESGETLYAYLENMERVNAKAELLGNYCMRRADEDTRNAAYQGMTGKFMSTVVALGAACSFDTPEIMAISDEKLAQFYADCLKLERYRRFLVDGGLVHLKTDSNFLYTYTKYMVEKNSLPLLVATEDLYHDDTLDEATRSILSIHTYYENQWIERGLNIKYMKFRLPAEGRLEESDIEIPLDEYRSYKRTKRSAKDTAK